MKDWISLFEKYRIDRRMYELYCHEYISLSQSSPRKAALEVDMTRLEHSICLAELLLSRYDSMVTSPKDALQRAEERLFLACHYINGLSIESTANTMGVSRDTAYRIRRRIMARGEIPEEIYEICKNHFLTDQELQDTRLRVESVQTIREACFAGSIPPKVTPLPSPKQTNHPAFLFSAK